MAAREKARGKNAQAGEFDGRGLLLRHGGRVAHETGERAIRSAQVALVGGAVVVMSGIRVVRKRWVFVAGALRVMRIVVLVGMNSSRLLRSGRWAEHGSRDCSPDGNQNRQEDQQPDSERSHSS